MSCFHDMVKADLAVFLDMDVFAESHRLNDIEVTCVIDTNTNAGLDAALSNSLEGIFLNTKRVFFRQGDFKPPAVDKQIRIDGSRHLVRDVKHEMGVIVMTVEEYQGP